jgi:hypothetical protein
VKGRIPGTAIVLLLLAVTATAGTDLAKRYKAKLDWEEDAGGRNWTCGPEDVWRLSGFRYRFRELRLEVGPGCVVFGVHGTSVVWAALIPDEPGRVRSADLGEEPVASVWMRFNPALVGKLFPKKTVLEHGPLEALLQGRRIYQHKISSGWQAENTPVVPWKHSLVFDVDTGTGTRRYFSVDTKKKKVEYVSAFAGRAVPPPPPEPITPAEAQEAFDGAWQAFDEHYAMFGLRPEVDWDALRKVYRPLAERAQTAYEAAGAIALLASHLRDLHVYVKAGETYLPGYHRCRLLNANFDTTKSLVGGLAHQDDDLAWGRTRDGLGYLAVFRLTAPDLAARFDRALETLGDTWGLVLDLRFNGGGGEDLALQLAGRFLDRECVYSLNRYRSGPKRDQLGPKLKRKCAPRGPWRYRGPVAVLIGQKTMSSAESFALMLSQGPQVTTVGDRTAGSSANPRRFDLPGGIVVNVPRWLDLDPKERPLDERGVQPEVHVETRLSAFRQGDPVMEAALKRLRKTSKGKRRPAHR